MAGALGQALGRVTRTPVALTCAGRTDAGVHALDQVVHFDLPAERSAGSTRRPWSGRATASWRRPWWCARRRWRPAGFDARHSATARRYRYLVVNAPVADPLLAGLTWQVADPLDLRLDGRRGRRPPRRARLPGLLPPGARHHPRRPHQPAGDRRPLDPAERAGGVGGGSGSRTGHRPPPGSRAWSRWWGTCWPSRSRPTPSATRWCAPWSAPWSTWAGAASGPRTCCGSSVRRPPAGLPAGPSPGADPDGRPLRAVTGLPARSDSSYPGRSPGRAPEERTACVGPPPCRRESCPKIDRRTCRYRSSDQCN